MLLSKLNPFLAVLYSSLLLFSANCFAQNLNSPGGIRGVSLWSLDGDSSDAIGNYHSLNLLNLKASADSTIPPMEGASSLFLVLKPNFNNAVGSAFIQLGDIEIFDNLLVHGTDSTTLDFSDGSPQIVTISLQRSSQFKTNVSPTFNLMDSTLFSVAELIYYPKFHSRQNIKMVNSYLALKYSIPITGVTDINWKDYWAADTSKYWDYKVDNQYHIRVLGLGASADENFYQSQTLASVGSFFQLSLDSVRPQGEMPNINIDEDAFLIFSERLPESYSSNYSCQVGGNNPLGNWKIRPHNWGSTADFLYVTLNSLSMPTSDSIWMTDGSNYTYVPKVNSTISHITYRILLDSIHNNFQYFFTDVKGNPCDPITITTIDDVLTVDLGTGIDGASLKYLDLNSGLTVEQKLLGNTFSTPISPGQYQVWVKDTEGNIITEQIARTNQSRVSANSPVVPALVLYPNPVHSGQTTRLMIKDLPTESPVQIFMTNASGIVLRQETMTYENGMVVEFTGNTPGFYTVSVIQDNIIYSQKLIVAAR
jgi:hypothetical protein